MAVALRAITIRSYSRYDVNDFHFCSMSFKATHPLAATTNSRVISNVVDDQGKMIKYYGVIKKIPV